MKNSFFSHLNSKFNRSFSNKKWSQLHNLIITKEYSFKNHSIYKFYITYLIKGGHYTEAVTFLDNIDKPFKVNGFEYKYKKNNYINPSYKNKSVAYIKHDLLSKYKLEYLGTVGHIARKLYNDDYPNFALAITQLRDSLQKKEFKNKKLMALRKRLLLTTYPSQNEDFVFLTLPSNFKNAGQEIPVDYMLKDIVLYLWKHKISTSGLGLSNNGSYYYIILNQSELKKPSNNKKTYYKKIVQLFKHIPQISIQPDFPSIHIPIDDLHLILTDLKLPHPDKNNVFAGNQFPFLNI